MVIRIGRREARAWRCFRMMLDLFEGEWKSRNALLDERQELARRTIEAERRVEYLAAENRRLWSRIKAANAAAKK